MQDKNLKNCNSSVATGRSLACRETITASMATGMQGSWPSPVRWWLGLLLSTMLTVQLASTNADVALRVQRVNDGGYEDMAGPTITLFEDTRATFTCFCLNETLGPSGGYVELLRNGFHLQNGSCFDRSIINETTITAGRDEGEYQCRVYFPSDPSRQRLVSDIRELIIFDPDDVVTTPPIQYALYGSTYHLQCNVTDGHPASVTWLASDDSVVDDVIEEVTLDHEGHYRCQVLLLSTLIETVKSVQLYVIVPPEITHPLPPTRNLTRNQAWSFRVEFKSCFIANTNVTWYYGNQRIQDEVTTDFTSSHEGHSTLRIPMVSRSNRGEYRVVVANNFSSIPESQRSVSSLVLLSIKVAPALPTQVTAHNISSNRVQITWVLQVDHPDQRPKTLSLLVTNMTDKSLAEYKLSGFSTSKIVDVVPGMRYQAVIIAENVDDQESTHPLLFQAVTAAPHVLKVDTKRLNMTSFNITTSLLYTGANDISHFSVSFRNENGTQWSNELVVEAHTNRMEPGLHWFGTVTSDGLRKPSDLKVKVVNDMGHASSAYIVEEQLVPLSAPSAPTLVASSHDSLTLSFTLPQEGTPPVNSIIVNFTSPFRFQWECTGANERDLGATLICTVPKLTSDTRYTLALFGIGPAGRGNTSREVSFSTTSIDNSLPPWVIAVVSVVVAMTILIVLLAVLLVVIHCFKLHNKKRHLYHFAKKTGPACPKPLDPSHSILNRSQKPSAALRELAPPVSPSSTSTPPPCRSTPSTTVTFKYETTSGSGSSCSNLDSDISEAQSPTYTYRITPPPPSCPPTIAQSPPLSLPTSKPIPCPSSSMQQSYHSLHRGVRMCHVPHSLHSTRESLVSCPPAPTHCATNV